MRPCKMRPGRLSRGSREMGAAVWRQDEARAAEPRDAASPAGAAGPGGRYFGETGEE